MNALKHNRYRNAAAVVAGILFTSFVVLQVNSPTIANPPVTSEFHGPEEVTAILKRSCYDCHSNETNLRWYDKIAPFSYKVAADVEEARKRFNFSEWDSIPKGDQEGKLWYIVNMIDAGRMPLPEYTATHPSAKVSPAELGILKKYVTEISRKHYATGDTAHIVGKPRVSQAPTSLNGIRYFDDYKNWKVISSTGRADNGTMRIIYGNDIAVKALEQDKIRPWPDGAVIAKVVWNSQAPDAEGNVKPGNFNNVQIMVRDAKKFTETEGWGFARFNGLELKPYGKTASFATACMNCHQLAEETGFVFDIPTKRVGR
ncbi:heme-binding domain-containing protein [Dyadobacter sp. CY261]|uniref:heme-binding domain-containing protein n=1 Tax=Dyadobacter sp. CY261 TaxID=2907203 RepID=UPI001F4872FD|nr:heme-binding domain-containing protein [Dyadobacter sp. CY261]MCF0074724.1 heme-binding domain-containing protein [Dyadobacter sp. CY261]